MTVGALLEEIGSGELAEWIAFYDLEPFGGQVDDLRAGLNPALTVNMNRDPKSDPVTPLSFFPWSEKTEPQKPVELSPEETAKLIKARIFKVADDE